MNQPFDPFAGSPQPAGTSAPGPRDLGGGAGARLFVSNKTYARLLTCEIPPPEPKMLTRRPGRCSEPLDEAKVAHEAKSFLERYLSQDSWGTPKSYYWPKSFERQCLLWPDQIPEAFLDAQQQRLIDHQTGRAPLHPEQSLALRRDVQLLEDIYRPGRRFEAPISAEEQAWLDARNLKFNNLLGTALLGPIFGGPAAITRAMGGTEEQIAAANEFGAVAWELLPAAQVMRGRGGAPRPVPQGGETVRGARLEPSARTAEPSATANAGANVSIRSLGAYVGKPIKPPPDQYASYKTYGRYDDPLASPEGRRLVRQFESQGLSPKDAKDAARKLMETGSNLPQANPVAVGDRLYKAIPEGDSVGAHSAFWATRSEIESLRGLTRDQIAARMGVPLESQLMPRFEIVEIRAVRPTMSFVSTIAPTTQNGWSQTGGGVQTLVTDRSAFSPPVRTGIKLP